MAASTRRRRINAATTWLIRAFSPGCPTLLRCWESQVTQPACERVKIVFDVPNDEARRRAVEMAELAGNLVNVRVGWVAIRDISAVLHAEHRTLTIDVLLMVEAAAAMNPSGARS